MAGGGRSEDVHRARGALVVVAGEDTFYDLAAAGPMLQRLAIEAGFAARLGIGLERLREPPTADRRAHPGTCGNVQGRTPAPGCL